jgi:hypothetical protein
MPVRAAKVIPQVRPVEPHVMRVIHAHREEERATVASPELEEGLQRVVSERA